MSPDLTGASCAGVGDPDLWFPNKGQSSTVALSICADCPVKAACLAIAMEHPCSGIWGGTTVDQRKELARRHGRAYDITAGCGDNVRIGIKPASAAKALLRARRQAGAA